LFFSVAAAQKGMGIAPPRFEIVAPAGSTLTKVLNVFSHDLPDQIIDVAVIDWWLDPEGTVQELPAGANPYSAASWLAVDTNPFSLVSGSAHSLRFSVTVPPADGSLAGSYWAAIAFTTRPNPEKSDSGLAVLVKTRVLEIVYVTIQGTEQPAAALQGLSMQAGADGERFIIADILNKSNVYLRLKGDLRFINSQGETVKQIALPIRVLLRDGLVRYRLQLPEDLPDDVVLATIEVQPEGPNKSYGGPTLYGEINLQ